MCCWNQPKRPKWAAEESAKAGSDSTTLLFPAAVYFGLFVEKMAEQRGFIGWFIPHELVSVYGFDFTEAALWAEIHALSARPEGCTASMDHFAEHLHLSVRQVQRMMGKLIREGLVSEVEFDGRRRTLMSEYPRRKRHFRGDRNVTPQATDLSPLEAPAYIREREEKNTPIPPEGVLGLGLKEPPMEEEPPKSSEALEKFRLRVGAMFGRRTTTKWNPRDEKALRSVLAMETPEDEVALLERYYATKYKYLRQDIPTLLNNWNGEIDRARKYFAAGGASEEPSRSLTPDQVENLEDAISWHLGITADIPAHKARAEEIRKLLKDGVYPKSTSSLYELRPR